jgi:hypothetical protein
MKEDKKEDSESNTDKEAIMEMFDHPGRILLDDLLYAIQFCHLCAIGKIPPVLYSLSSDGEINSWLKSTLASKHGKNSSSTKRQNPSTPDSDSDSQVSSPETKISKKVHYFINTMKKLHNTMDKSSKSKEDKEPGFKRLEAHRKNLILNASATPPFTTTAENPTHFYQAFLAKKCQFKAKDMLLHRF